MNDEITTDVIFNIISDNYFAVKSFKKLNSIGLKYLSNFGKYFKGSEPEFNTWVMNEGSKYKGSDNCKQSNLAMTLFIDYLINLRLRRNK